MKASEAFKKAITYRRDKRLIMIGERINKLNKAIKEAADKGELWIWVDYHLSEEEQDHFIKNGYTVWCTPGSTDKSSSKIQWGNEI